MFPNTQKFLSVLVLSLSFLACGGSPDIGPGPTVSSISPNKGSHFGGEWVWIDGMNLSGATVTFGGVPATMGSTQVSGAYASTPVHAVGFVDVTVTIPNGKSVTLRNGFKFVLTAEEYARTILEVFGLKEWANLGVATNPIDSTGIPYSEATLRAKSTTHMLVFIPSGVSILDLQKKLPAGTIAFCDTWNPTQPFASNTNGSSGWHLVRKTVAPGSLGLLESEQWGTLIGGEFMLNTRVLTFALVGHYLMTGETLMSGVFARTTDNTWPGGTNLMTAFAGGNAYGGIVGICSDWGETRVPTIGIAADQYPEPWLVVP